MKIDLHCHSYYSYDGISSPEELIKSALKKGLDGIAITDHDTIASWQEAKKAAKKLNAFLILGEEIKTKQGDILGLFLKKEINGKGKDALYTIKEIKKQGGIAIIAHPYHWRKPFRNLEKYKNLADGIEVFNARSQSKKGNQKAFNFAVKNNLVMTAGSDAHSSFEIGNAYLEAKAENLEELREMILEKKVKIIGKQAPFFVQIFAGAGKLIHLFWHPKS